MADDLNVNQPEQMEVEIAGAVFKGTKDEIFEKMKTSIANSTTHIRDLNAQNKELAGAVTNLSQKVTKPADSNGWNKERYFTMLAEDPIAAQEYIDEHRYGVNPAEFRAKLGRAIETAENVRQLQEVARFRNFVGFKDSDGLEADETQAILDTMAKRNQAASAENMFATYHELVTQGKVKDYTSRGKESQERTTRRPPPSATGGGDISRVVGKDPNSMSADEIKAAMAKLRGE